jgi:branched-subunit amino acid aminotransferase/4-amino-4-deoxychorismate lyase
MAELPKVDKIWMDGELVDWDKAQIHVLTHALHYGSGVFEGIRAYETSTGAANRAHAALRTLGQDAVHGSRLHR